MKRMILTMLLVFIMLIPAYTTTKPEEKAPPITQPQTSEGVWHIEKVVYTLMRCNNLYYTLTLRYTAMCTYYPATWEGYTIWQHTVYYLQDPTCDPYMEIYTHHAVQYVTFDAVITVVYKNIYGGYYYDQELRRCVYPPYSFSNPIEYP